VTRFFEALGDLIGRQIGARGETGAGPGDGASAKARWLRGLFFVIAPLLLHAMAGFVFVTEPAPRISGVTVKVILDSAERGDPVIFSVDGSYRLFRGGGLRAFHDPGFIGYGYRLDEAEARWSQDEGIWIKDRLFRNQDLTLVPEENGDIQVGSKHYSGILHIERGEDDGVRLVNLLDMEDYLAAVLFREMPASFPREALKSQVVAARTYTLYCMTEERGFLLPDSRSQMYGGTRANTAYSREIVNETVGEVLTFEGQLFPAYYSSTCGGITARACDEFSSTSPEPLNQGIPCGYCSDSPYYSWTATLSAAETAEKFELPLAIASTVELGVTQRDTTGRSRELAFFDQRGNLLLRLDAGRFKRILNRGRDLKYRMLSCLIDDIRHRDGRITIEGRGWGHGVGFCQYGSRRLALQGSNHRQILEYYYRGSKIQPLTHLENLADKGSINP